MTEQVTIHIDGVAHQVDAGSNLLEACLKLQMDMPYFCWHPAMGSAGSCRQCAVIQYQNAQDERGRLVMSCMTPVSEGMIVSMENEKATTFRATAIEAIMTNHPHDCPVCEEGGDCHLQDMTLISGHIKREYPGSKRTHLNQYLGPFLNHEMNRCIGCYRCVRFYRDYCGGNDFNVFSSRNRIYFGRGEPGELENEFAGNLAEVCPTGVFTDKPFSQQYTRKWDLQSAPTVCTLCSVGCNTYTSERDGILRKVANRFNPEVNAHFLCDRGRFGYEHVNHKDRLEQPWQRNNEQQKVDILSASAAADKLTQWFSEGDNVVVGSTRSSIENNAALLKLVGKNNFYVAVSDSEMQQLKMLNDSYTNTALAPMSLNDVEQCDAMLMVGEDFTHTAPRLALSIRQMTRNAGIEKAAKMRILPWQDEAVRNIAQDLTSPLHIVTTHSSRLADVAKANINLPPAKQLALLMEVEAHLSNPDENDTVSEQAKQIAQDLLQAKKPALVTGTNSNNPQILAVCLRLAALLQQTNSQTGFYCATGQANSLAIPVLCPQSQGLNSLQQRLTDRPPKSLVIMEADLYRYFDDTTLDQLLDKVQHIVVIDQLLTRTAQMADLVLPSTSFAESHASWLSAEGRLQHAYAAMPKQKGRLPAWHWLQTLAGFQSNQQIMQWCVQKHPALAAMEQFIDKNDSDFTLARQPLRSTGRTAIHADVDVKEYPPEQDNGSQLEFSMEGVPSFRQHQLTEFSSPPTGVWQPKWNSGQGINKSLDLPGQNGICVYTTQTDSAEQAIVQTTNQDSTTKSPNDISVCPRHHIYADDELAAYSASLQQLIPTAQVSLNAQQAASMGLSQGDTVQLKGKILLQLPCSIESDIADGIVLVPLQHYLLLGAEAHVQLSKSEATHE